MKALSKLIPLILLLALTISSLGITPAQAAPADWVLGPEWEIGSATASTGGQYGADPAADNTPTTDNRIAGVVIGGNASTSLHGFSYLTSPVVDTSGATGTLTFEYYRWLNSDYTPYMQNTVDVWNGSSWVNLWITGSSPGINDSSWAFQSFDLTAYKNTNMQVRFGFMVGSSGVYTIGSWNVDDVRLYDSTGDLFIEDFGPGGSNNTVTFDAQGGAPTPSDQTVSSGGLVTDPGDPSLTGYTFNGWYTASAGGTKWNFASDTVSSDMTLYAQWIGTSCITTTAGAFPVGGFGFGDDVNERKRFETFVFPGTPGLALSDVQVVLRQIPSASSQSNVTVELYATSSNLPTGSPLASATIPANSIGTTFATATATFSTTGLVLVPNATYALVLGQETPQSPRYEWGVVEDVAGAEFGKLYYATSSSDPGVWTNESGLGDGWLKGYCMPAPIVSFDPQGGSPTPPAQTVIQGGLAADPGAPSLTGYTFNGWYTADTGGAKWNFASDTVSGDMTLYAQWTANNHTVIFDANGGNGTMSPQVANLPTALTANAFTWAGYTFSSWNTAADGSGTSYADQDIYDFDADITMYAQWSSNGIIVHKSKAAQDGWIRESTATSSEGGRMNIGSDELRVGDNSANKQYISIMSFDTSSLPDNAVIISATLKFKYAGKSGTPFGGTLGDLMVDVRNGAFNDNPDLELIDFSAEGLSTEYKANVMQYSIAPFDKWFTQVFDAADFEYIDLMGVTQFRLHFGNGDNGDKIADIMRIYSGNAETVNRPQLIIEYYVP